MQKTIVIIGLATLVTVVLLTLAGDTHEYPCGVHLNNGYYRQCEAVKVKSITDCKHNVDGLNSNQAVCTVTLLDGEDY